jgi:hypothetical protein
MVIGLYLVVNKTFFVFISSVLLSEELFKLYRMTGDSLFKYFTFTRSQRICSIEGVVFIPCQVEKPEFLSLFIMNL